MDDMDSGETCQGSSEEMGVCVCVCVCVCGFQYKYLLRASLGVQRFSVHLGMQGTLV